jgi:dTDP-4-amino-4,6-dideoxygalactose transaminase
LKNTEYIVFGRPSFSQDEIEAVVETLRSGWVGTGPRTKEFEQRFGEYIGCRYAVAAGSCTAALHIAMLSANVGPGDEVITTPLTFAATANAIVHTGATPVLADVSPRTMNIDPAAVQAAITPRTRAILPVHLTGRPCDMDPLLDIARRHKLFVLEDAAHAIETWYHGRKIGTFGNASCFSFYVTKNLTTIEGGMLCTDDQEIADKARILALHGMSADAWARFSDRGYRHYEVMQPGFKYNMTDVQATIGLRQLPKLSAWLERRRQIWSHYDELFAGLPCERPAPEERDTVHARHLYTLLIDPETARITRDQFMAALHERGIGTGVHYRSLHIHRYYRERFGYQPNDYPNAYRIGESTVSIPLSPTLTDGQVDRVAQTVQDVLRR